MNKIFFISTKEFYISATSWGVLLTLIAYGLGIILRKKFRLAIFNPLLISITIIVLFLVIFKIDFSYYDDATKYIRFLLTPATVCLAIPLYQQFELLKKNAIAIIFGIFSAVLSSCSIVFLFSFIFKFAHVQYITLLPKSITTAIGMDLSQEMQGIVSITVASIIVTGIIGNITAPYVCKYCKINNPIARGIAIGSSSHAIGTAKALEMGEIEGAMSALSIALSGLLTVLFMPLFANFI